MTSLTNDTFLMICCDLLTHYRQVNRDFNPFQCSTYAKEMCYIVFVNIILISFLEYLEKQQKHIHICLDLLFIAALECNYACSAKNSKIASFFFVAKKSLNKQILYLSKCKIIRNKQQLRRKVVMA